MQSINMLYVSYFSTTNKAVMKYHLFEEMLKQRTCLARYVIYLQQLIWAAALLPSLGRNFNCQDSQRTQHRLRRLHDHHNYHHSLNTILTLIQPITQRKARRLRVESQRKKARRVKTVTGARRRSRSPWSPARAPRPPPLQRGEPADNACGFKQVKMRLEERARQKSNVCMNSVRIRFRGQHIEQGPTSPAWWLVRRARWRALAGAACRARAAAGVLQEYQSSAHTRN